MANLHKPIKTVTLGSFLTDEEIARARELYAELKDTGAFAKTIEAELIAPNIERINKSLGQENLPRFLAYAIEYAFSDPHIKALI